LKQFFPKEGESMRLISKGLVWGSSFILLNLVSSFSAHSASKNQLQLKILTFNIWGSPTAKDPSRHEDIGRILGEQRKLGLAPQVVLIQEAFTSRAVRALTQLSGYPYSKFGPGAGPTKASSGLIILSEFPITASAAVKYTRCTSWDCFANKGAVHSRLSIPGLPHPFEIFNTHMNSNPDTDFWTPIEQAQEMRFLQSQELREFSENHRISEAPVIFGGDFNFNRTGFDYESFVGFTSTSNAAEECGQLGPSRCQGSQAAHQYWQSAIDHQFYDRGRSPRVDVQPIEFRQVFTELVKGRRLSDHPGVEITYLLSWN
jgi:endonuclease/exonuclease/phosphatase family metal-dependent hydrolase